MSRSFYLRGVYLVAVALSFVSLNTNSVFGRDYGIELSRSINSSMVNDSSSVGNVSYTWLNSSSIILNVKKTASPKSGSFDCLGLGSTVATALAWFLGTSPSDSKELDVRFFLSSRNKPRRVEVVLGKQFGLEWVDFQIERRTVVIVHGFLSHGNESWIRNMERAFLTWNDVNLVVVDWSAGGNSWNYYKAVVNTRIVGQQIARFLGQLMNSTEVDSDEPHRSDRGRLHMIGHSLGAHICGFAARELKRAQSRWVVKRITGLDPAQPCFETGNLGMQLNKTDALFVDVIHTNGRLLSYLGLGLPEPIGHVDFYPNGGKKQPGCPRVDASLFDMLPISKSRIEQTICSHGRSYLYLTESLLQSANADNCTFWGRHWDLTYRNAIRVTKRSCNETVCTEMGINAENYPHRGTFYVITAESPPFCVNNTTNLDDIDEHLREDLGDELED